MTLVLSDFDKVTGVGKIKKNICTTLICNFYLSVTAGKIV